jgi:putative transposase
MADVKYEDIYLNGYSTATELQCGLKKYFIDYNVGRPHQSLGYSTPEKVYRAASGGGARMVDKYRKLNKPTEELKVKGEQCLSAA